MCVNPRKIVRAHRNVKSMYQWIPSEFLLFVQKVAIRIKKLLFLLLGGDDNDESDIFFEFVFFAFSSHTFLILF